MNSDSQGSPKFTRAFLQELLKTCPKFVMVLDNASCHKSKMVTEFVESTDGDIWLVFLPPYTT